MGDWALVRRWQVVTGEDWVGKVLLILATGTAGLELLGTQRYIQQIFDRAALVAAITIPTVNRERFFKRKRIAA